MNTARVHGPCARSVDTGGEFCHPCTRTVDTDRAHDQWTRSVRTRHHSHYPCPRPCAWSVDTGGNFVTRAHGPWTRPCPPSVCTGDKIRHPCTRTVRTARGHGPCARDTVHTTRVHGPCSTRVSKSIARQCFLTPVLSTVRGHGSLHGARFTLPVHMAVSTGDKIRHPCPRTVRTVRVHG